MEVAKLTRVKKALVSLDADAKFDYSRLAYESSAVRSALALCDNDPVKVQEMWGQVKASGDKHKIKAWLDSVPALIPEHSPNPADEMSWRRLKEDMAGSNPLTDSEEMKSYEKQRREHLEELADILRTTQAIGSDFDASYKGQNLFQRVFEGISTDPETNELIVDFGKTENETPEGTYARLEVERGEREKAQAEVMENFGKDYNPILDGA